MVVFTRIWNRGIPIACLLPVTKHFVGKCFVHDTGFYLRDTFAEVVVTFLGNTREKGFVVKHADSILIRSDGLLEVFCIEVRLWIAFLIAFGFGGFIVRTSFEELTHQLDEVELRKWTIIPQLGVFFSGFDVLFEFTPLDVGKTELNLCGEDIELIIVLVLIDKLACHDF